MAIEFKSAAEAKEALKLVNSAETFKAFKERLDAGDYPSTLAVKRTGCHAFSFKNHPLDADKAHYLIDNGRTGKSLWTNLHKVLVVVIWLDGTRQEA